MLKSEKMKNSNKSKAAQISLYVLFILLPVILLLLVSYINKCNAFAREPMWSDEISYWREVFSFSHCGMHTGYNGIQEMIPKIGTFSTHGFFPSVFYFPFAKILGWGNNGVVIANLLFTILCFLIFICVFRPSIKQTIGLIVLYMFYPPILYFAATSLTEIINYGLLSLFFVCFYLYYKANDKRSKYVFLALMVLIGTICSFYRIIYVVLFILPVVALIKMKSFKFIALIFLWIFYSAFLYYVSSLFIAPYPSGVLYNVIHAGSVKGFLYVILHNVKINIKLLFDIRYGEYVEVFFRAFYLFIILLYFSFMVLKATIKRGNKKYLIISFRDSIDCFYLMQFLLLLLPLCIVISIYDVGGFRDYRVLAPFLWASLLNLVLFKRRVVFLSLTPLLIVFFSASLFFCPTIFRLPIDTVWRYSQSEKIDWTLINEYVKYDKNASDPFENTILLDKVYFELWSHLDPGIGIEFGNIAENLKSRYLLIDTNTEIHGYTCMGATEFGYLYIKN